MIASGAVSDGKEETKAAQESEPGHPDPADLVHRDCCAGDRLVHNQPDLLLIQFLSRFVFRTA